MKAVITVIGQDMVGILAKISTECAKANANVIEVTQSVLQDLFAMIMLVDITQLNTDIADLSDRLQRIGDELGLNVNIMHEKIFNSMHRI